MLTTANVPSISAKQMLPILSIEFVPLLINNRDPVICVASWTE